MIVNNKIGITLSGGGFRSVAHLGVLQYLKELEIELDAISGASAGALIGALIAEGYTPLDIFQFSKVEKFFNYLDISAKNGGLFNTVIFEKIIKKYIPHDSFEGLKIPLYVSVTDLTNAQSLIFNEGSLSFAVKASCCFPLVFQPVHYIDDIYLCDGGLLNNFPVDQIRATCSRTIGINVNPINKFDGKLGYREIAGRIIRITTSRIRTDAKSNCDIYMQPDEINRFSTFDAKKIDELYQFGYEYAQKFKRELLAIKKSKQE